jgi:hypothetical protein
MPETSWACPICKAAHLELIDVPQGVIDTHRDEHMGPGGSNADAFPAIGYPGMNAVVREGNGNRWVNREPATEEPIELAYAKANKLDDFDESLACDAGACEHECIPIDDDGAPCCPTPAPERITDEAWRLVMGDRGAAYGHPDSDFKAMGRITGAIINRWLESEGYGITVDGDRTDFPDIPPRIVALIQTAVKLSRESAKPKRDNRVDGIGYWLCADRIERHY